MKKTTQPLSPKLQSAIDAVNAKYTYNQVCVFHETILLILGNSDLSCLKKAELKGIEQFVLTIAGLLSSSSISANLNRACQSRSFGSIPEIRKPIPRQENNYYAKRNLYDLVYWIDFINHKESLTIEMILDDYYNHFPFSQSAMIMEEYLLRKTTSS
ncbi:hypothetical protein [Pedobacter cryoconitis]|uniref:Uncharacterized protein n=1 Tax=Pedobacter cryoconitis TaxID=188932 RepID=A0A7X0MH90_9SPHI|nr:hypothetical protein [Pedobacter cryoconitis]MBB6499142.1 hypothetical protein [Pedobacter cryoconitis]